MSKTLLVTGSTGKQGGAVVRALQGSDFEILALTRNVSSSSAQKLTHLSSNIKLLQGDLGNATAIFEKAKEISNNPIWGVFSIQVCANVMGTGGEIEEKQGKDLVDASIAADVKFFVYTSVDRGGSKSDAIPTPVPHWACKQRIETHLKENASRNGMEFTILRPTAFMEILSNDFNGKLMATMWRTVLKEKPLQMVATKDIGWFAAQAFKYPDQSSGKSLSLAGTEVTFQQANEIFRQKFGRDLPSTFGIVSHVLLRMAKELSLMLTWMKEEGTAADVEGCRRLHPEMLDLGAWLETESAFKSC
ncbi:NAD(P)-binding protein [Lindgomyces ingoldianus]|uniref:NAD(P)-binding protein n=1 Tax=Lindgomyces ingoldianus TaxID=673940 RepID=A0ACB6R973_9PLEO|nr:NAD(P)-binding protein [Lindgomyces ingoldianus]KAF2475726.1 NAD(P)-binding protein [Lindgomyces ingoldianus]